MKDINIVIVNYFCKDNILQAINSLIADIKNCPYNVQITVSDNSRNSDNIKCILKQFPQVKYINCKKNVGFGMANTIGFKATQSRYYFTFNPDIIILPNQ